MSDEETITLTAPGPSPWYLRAPDANITTSSGEWKWGFYESPLTGLAGLTSPQGQTVLFVDFQCYLQPMSDGRLIIWYEIGRDKNEQGKNPGIIFTIVELNALGVCCTAAAA
jgi:hypothetical protein